MANDYSNRVKKYSPWLKNTGFSAMESIKVTGYFLASIDFVGTKSGAAKPLKI